MAKKNDSLGDRMKGYEGVSRNFLTRRVPAIIRLDGKAFHTFTKGEVAKMKTHTLKFKGNHGRPKKIAEIRDLNEAGRPKSDQDILDEAFLLIHAFCAERNFKIYYTRTWNHNGVTIFDVGSHTEFFHLTPAVSLYADTTSSERSEQNG